MTIKTIKSAIIYTLTLTILTFTSCKKKTETPKEEPVQTYGSLEIEFTHKWGMSLAPFALNTQLIHPKTGDTMSFSMLKYYVSNIKLKNTNGTYWSEKESYYLINVKDSNTCVLKILNIPTGTYNELQYTMGVDSERNVSGAQSGALSTANDMFWTWNSGYIMVKAEGSSPNSPTNDFAFHLGGFKGNENIVTPKSINLTGQALEINPSNQPKALIVVNPARFWHTMSGLNTTSKIHMPGALAKQAATDFYNGITLEKIIP